MECFQDMSCRERIFISLIPILIKLYFSSFQGGLTALFTPAEMGNTDVMNVLIDMGANVNHINKVRQDMKASNKASNFIGVP